MRQQQHRAQVPVNPYWLRPDPQPIQVGPRVGTLTLSLVDGRKVRVVLCTEQQSMAIDKHYGDAVVSAAWMSDPPGGPVPSF